jgi:hypothetical protein
MNFRRSSGRSGHEGVLEAAVCVEGNDSSQASCQRAVHLDYEYWRASSPNRRQFAVSRRSRKFVPPSRSPRRDSSFLNALPQSIVDLHGYRRLTGAADADGNG